MFLSDLLALAIAMGIALWVVFGGMLPPKAGARRRVVVADRRFC